MKENVSEIDVIRKEVEVVRKMIDDETWYEGERRHMMVDRNDPTVMGKVCDLLMDMGSRIYKEVEETLKPKPPCN